jgi:hypothetical protein
MPVFADAETVIDTATYDNPKSAPHGIAQLLVNGRFAVRDGEVHNGGHAADDAPSLHDGLGRCRTNTIVAAHRPSANYIPIMEMDAVDIDARTSWPLDIWQYMEDLDSGHYR